MIICVFYSQLLNCNSPPKWLEKQIEIILKGSSWICCTWLQQCLSPLIFHEGNFTETHKHWNQGLYWKAALKGRLWLLHDPPDGAHSSFGSSPLRVVSVLAFLQQVLATAEVGMFKEHPGPVEDLAGLDFTPEELLLHRLHVVRQLQSLTVEVGSIEQPQLVRPFGLKARQSRKCVLFYAFSLFKVCWRLTFLMILQDLTQSLKPIQRL